MNSSTALVPVGARGLIPANPGLVRSLFTGGFFIAAATAAYIVFKKIIQSVQQGILRNQVGTNTPDGLALGYASRFYAAMFQGNTEWWSDWFGDGTDEESIFKVGREMFASKVSFGLVSAKYKGFYSRDLYTDLSKELSGEDLAKFQSVLTSGLGNTPAGPPPPLINQALITTSATTVLNETLQVVVNVPAAVWLGAHDETIILGGGRVLHGFMYENQRRYVPAPAVRQVPLR